jgi:hypothetical protein
MWLVVAQLVLASDCRSGFHRQSLERPLPPERSRLVEIVVANPVIGR